MKKIFFVICLFYLFQINAHPLFVRADETDDYDYLKYHIEDAVDGFQPPENETIQFMVKDMVVRESWIKIGFWREWYQDNSIQGNTVFRIANKMEKIPCGQHHRFTLLVSSEKKQPVFWYSSNPEVAGINLKTGELTAVSTGSTRIWVEDKNGVVRDEIKLEVIQELSKEDEDRLYTTMHTNVIGPIGRWGEFRNAAELILPEEAPGLVDCFGMHRLEQVRIPASVKVIAYDCSESDDWGIRHGEKVTFSVDGNNTNYYSISGVLFSYPFYSSKKMSAESISLVQLLSWYADCGKNTLLCYPSERQGEVYYVPYGVERIAGRAFEGTKYLRKVVLPDTVTALGGAAFSDCEGLEEIVIPASVTEFEDNGYVDVIDRWSSLGITIVTPSGSAAEAYAIEHGIKYRNE